MQTAKVFRHGGSQAVRLPAEYRFDHEEVFVWRDEATGYLCYQRNRPRGRVLSDCATNSWPSTRPK